MLRTASLSSKPLTYSELVLRQGSACGASKEANTVDGGNRAPSHTPYALKVAVLWGGKVDIIVLLHSQTFLGFADARECLRIRVQC